MKKSVRLISVVFLAWILSACAAAPGKTGNGTDTAAAEETLTVNHGGMESGNTLHFATGSDQGTYSSLGRVLAETVGEATETKVQTVSSGGAKDNIQALGSGMVELAFCQSDVMVYAYTGSRLFDKPVDNFSAAACLYIEQLQIVAADPSIRTVEDLRGRNVSLGAPGTGGYYNALDVLNVYGLTEGDIHPFYYSFGDSAEALKDGRIDAAFIVAGIPTSAVKNAAGAGSCHLVGLDEEHADALHGICPYYRKTVIPKETYTGMTQDVTTVGVSAVVLAKDEVPEADVYNFLYGIFENTGCIAALHEKGKDLDLSFAASSSGVPYHPGAAKYFEEKGIPVRVK